MRNIERVMSVGQDATDNRYNDISPDQQAVVDFYDKKLLPYAKKLKKDYTIVEQDGGERLQIPLTEQDAKNPVMAYKRAKKTLQKKKQTI